MNALKVLCFLSASIHFIFTLSFSIACILICLWYDDPQKLDTSYKFQETPYWIWVLTSIFFVFSLLSTISLIRGIAKEMPALFNAFFSNMIFLIIFTVFRATVAMIRQILNNFSASLVAAEFCAEIAICIFIGVTMVPCFILYRKLSGHSYFEGLRACCCCFKNCRDKKHLERLPHYPLE